jgi:hypothetical protein
MGRRAQEAGNAMDIFEQITELQSLRCSEHQQALGVRFDPASTRKGEVQISSWCCWNLVAKALPVLAPAAARRLKDEAMIRDLKEMRCAVHNRPVAMDVTRAENGTPHIKFQAFCCEALHQRVRALTER